MGKKSRGATATADRPKIADEDVPVVGMREPCPCGSGKRYKACHGRLARQEAVRLVERPFQGLPQECDWVALREIVPAATITVRLKAEFGGGEATVATVLPMAWPALHRADGAVLLGLQTSGASGDPSRDLAANLLKARELDPGSPLTDSGLPGPGPRLQDILEPAEKLDLTIHEGFEFWFADDADLNAEVKDSLEQANGSAIPTKRLSSVEAAYWCQMGQRRHLRWVLPDDETQVLNALARLHAAGESSLLEGSKYVGSFRAHGLVVPVWDVADDTEADDLDKPMAAFEERFRVAMANTEPLSADERRAKAGMLARQLTLR
jgi:hypothetical protein